MCDSLAKVPVENKEMFNIVYLDNRRDNDSRQRILAHLPHLKRAIVINSNDLEDKATTTTTTTTDLCTSLYTYELTNFTFENFEIWLKEQQTTNFVLKCVPAEIAFSWLDYSRDFIYTSAGLNLLRTRYLQCNEPIQYGLLRIASLFAMPINLNVGNNKYQLVKVQHMLECYYNLLSIGKLAVSSILAYASTNPNVLTNTGEACRLVVCKPEYDAGFVVQMEQIKTIVSLGVGVGIGASTVPLNGIQQLGKIQSGFKQFVKSLDSCNYLSIHKRKPKVAVYVHIDCDTVLEIFEMKRPTRDRIENVFFGLLVSDEFMQCVKSNSMWYMFSGQLRDDESQKTLRDYDHDFIEYNKLREKFIYLNLYTNKMPARVLMSKIVESICCSGNPYIVWIDKVNKFNNHAHRGTISTLNLCAEIVNYCNANESTSCTLMSVNLANDKKNWESTFKRCMDILSVYYNISEFNDYIRATDRLAFNLGFAATIALNNMLGNRQDREIGVTPFGMYDAALIELRDPVDLCEEMSEALYKGCVAASCRYSSEHQVLCRNYLGSAFSRGVPQWALRGIIQPNSDWTALCERMKQGMANSMLTAQAPTATTSLLMGACESITIPPSDTYTRESGNGRNRVIPLGIAQHILLNAKPVQNIPNDIGTQLQMYTVSAPYIDQSQSTMFHIDINDPKAVFDLLVETYKANLKTGLYYVVPKNTRDTLTIVRDFTTNEQKPSPPPGIECDACVS
ncbi:ribonucleoside-diphosphate reductase large chain-like [Nilaparvata lugens]|uniref:ribonucleoside-diphosphate reductase large chain-like n=1 Tax=Nilaparvata lugens TaxID=108931 RepID=UPI00193D5BB4|nr:ribonucleoside-diphosphate reductase large chain-like [Nilaparvata lugens]